MLSGASADYACFKYVVAFHYRLKFQHHPTAMTSIQQPRVPAAIDRALRNFRTNLDSKEKADFSHVHTEVELMALIDSLEAEQAARGCIRNMTRIMPFVNGLSQYARVIEVFVQVKPDILSFIWVRKFLWYESHRARV